MANTGVPDILLRSGSVWGEAVKKKLAALGLTQTAFIAILRENGFAMEVSTLNNMIRGLGARGRPGVVAFISNYLELKFDGDGKDGDNAAD